MLGPMADGAMMDECSSFLHSCPAPANLATAVDEARSFVARQQTNQRHVVLITSGGTSIPLEKQAVRYLDNFSSGKRGATSAECFLRRGYAVIFLYRETSLQPFHRHITSRGFLDCLSVDQAENIQVSPSSEGKGNLASILSLYQKVKEEASLLQVPYTTLFDFAHLLRELSLSLRPLASHAMLYHAAAVSDFFIHPSDMAEHKIQSSGKLELMFQNTPKLLIPLREKWAPHTFTVTFKLETDPELLVPHARAALEKYQHQVVIANLLRSRHTTVTMVTEEREEVLQLAADSGVAEIEEQIVDRLIDLHTQHTHTHT